MAAMAIVPSRARFAAAEMEHRSAVVGQIRMVDYLAKEGRTNWVGVAGIDSCCFVNGILGGSNSSAFDQSDIDYSFVPSNDFVIH